MNQYIGPGTGGSYSSYDAASSGRQPGSRRAKLKSYLRAANELRQSYMRDMASEWDNRDDKSDPLGSRGVSGTGLDASIVHGGDDEMILFPSYARKHVKQSRRQRQQTNESAIAPPESVGYKSENEPWRQNWEQYEDDNAVVDVDVRGWVYTPHRGPLNRKQRLYFTVARQLAGIPSTVRTPQSGTPPRSRDSSPRSFNRQRLEDRYAQDEKMQLSEETRRIVSRGEAEVAIAERGGYVDDSRSTYRSDSKNANVSAAAEEAPSTTPVQKRASWPVPGDMSDSQLSVANAHLMARLRPFISTPMANTPISAFFYNEHQSRQRTIFTNSAGHFALRASLDFIPTHVRILASDKLSATEEVIVTDPVGISVISDIDDTVKHTAMTSGARESFRNAFIRDLDDLTIEGVKDWYNRLARLGVNFHYVSNTPWQLYPTVAKFLFVAGLPPGSVHLKLYSGMLQGIFEPVAERKKSTMDRLAHDFPDRKFILVGDSGEADLEVYTDFVIENPGRVLGVFIRDVTTTANPGFFDGSMNALTGRRSNVGPRRNYPLTSRSQQSSISDSDDDPDLKAAIAASLKDIESLERNGRPPLPARRGTERTVSDTERDGKVANLIDFSDEDARTPSVAPRISQSPDRMSTTSNPRRLERTQTDSALSTLADSTVLDCAPVQSSNRPQAPPKPARMRSSSNAQQTAMETELLSPPALADADTTSHESKSPPPKPRRPSSNVQYRPREPSLLAHTRPLQSPTSSGQPKKPPPPLPNKPPTYASLAKKRISSAYNRLPNPPSVFSNATDGSDGTPSSEDTDAMGWSSTGTLSDRSRQNKQSSSTETGSSSPEEDKKKPPPPPPRQPASRRALTSYPAAAAQYATNRVSSAWNAYQYPSPPPRASAFPVGEDAGGAQGSPSLAALGLSKKEQLWHQRWIRAEGILRDRGVVLKSWRVGKDVEELSCRLVEEAMTEYGHGMNGNVVDDKTQGQDRKEADLIDLQ